MKIIKSLGTLIVLYLILYFVIGSVLPKGGAALQSILTLFAVIAFILIIISNFLGSSSQLVNKKLWRIIVLVVCISVSGYIVFTLLEPSGDFVTKFLEKTIPFGEFIVIMVKMIFQGIQSKANIFSGSAEVVLFYVVENLFKLLLSTLIFRITTKFFLTPFISENGNGYSLFSWKLFRVSLSDIIVNFIGAIISCFAIMLLITNLGPWLASIFNKTGEWINFWFQLIGFIALLIVFLIFPIMEKKIALIGSFIKLFVINLTFILVALMVQYKQSFFDIAFVILGCIAVNVICVILFPKEKET